MTKELSALLDGELETHESCRLWSDMKADSQLRLRWVEYQVIGASLRHDETDGLELTAKVMRSLAEEPVVLAPMPPSAKGWQGSVLALAASVAGVAVVAWLALAPTSPSSEYSTMARMEKVPAAATVAPGQGLGEYQEYLLAHQANAPGLHMQGGAQHIRTVSAFVNAQ
jgi:sigma-E factor negative regulatory protein RseA